MTTDPSCQTAAARTPSRACAASRRPLGPLRGRRAGRGRGARRGGRRLQPAHRPLGRVRRRHLPAARQPGPLHQGRPAHGAEAAAGAAHLRLLARVDRRGGAGGAGHRPAHVQRRRHRRPARGRLRVHGGRARHAGRAPTPDFLWLLDVEAFLRGPLPPSLLAESRFSRYLPWRAKAAAQLDELGWLASWTGLQASYEVWKKHPTREKVRASWLKRIAPDGTVKTPPSSEARRRPQGAGEVERGRSRAVPRVRAPRPRGGDLRGEDAGALRLLGRRAASSCSRRRSRRC